MTDGVVISLIGATSAVVIAFVPLLIAIWRGHQRVVRDVREVHILVNSQKSQAELYTAMLIATLRSAGVDVPVNPNPPPDIAEIPTDTP